MNNNFPLEMLHNIGRFLDNISTPPSPSANTLQKYKDLIRDLMLYDTLLYDCAENIDPAQFPNLQSLTVVDPCTVASTYTSTDETESDSSPFEPEQPFRILLQLRQLDLDSIQPHKIAWFLAPIAQFPHLRSLEITETKIDRDGALNLWKTIHQLETLKLIEVDFLDLGVAREQMSTMQSPRLTKLHLLIRDEAIPMKDQLLLIQACSTLTNFIWINVRGGEEYPFRSDIKEIQQAFALDGSDKIEELEIAGTVADSDIALAINTMPRIRSLILTENDLGPLSFQALQPHLSTLCQYDVRSQDTSSRTVQAVLCSCPVLQALGAGIITAKDAIAEDKERACASTLKALDVSFSFQSHEAHLQDAVFARLARLTQLEQLIMDDSCDFEEGEFGLRLSLEQGLAKLSTLTAMKFLSTFDDDTQELQTEEIQWMWQHWPHLRALYTNNRVIRD
ncbi:hypothetical protein EC968_008402 [Mortierella alpina]|nr:hypothetical protein EC968_008402 [Mortierella alpina]